jgi:formylglycine-generating enzyme required for sulfatase activity/tetratricopeptide (TPR) repeat protein/tRNA A-37 threonylcarbamoyl transferase component Bud32
MSGPARGPAADRNLLFGILAVQMEFVSRDQLIAAMHAWVLDKATSLGRILCRQQVLGSDEHDLLEALVEKHLRRHGDVHRSLAVLAPAEPARILTLDLEQLADADVQASLGHLALRSAGPDYLATRSPTAGPPAAGEAQLSRPSPGSAPAPGPRFRILRPHARGALGEVFVALDQELRREVALKEIRDHFADDPHSRTRFVLEAEVTGRLEHPGIIPVYGLGTYPDGRPFYAMRLVKGQSLHEAIDCFHQPDPRGQDAGQRGLELRQLLGRFVDVCNALAYAHSQGVIHRDLKPANVMLGPYGETLVVDWGLAKPVGSKDETRAVEPPLQPSGGSSSLPTQMGQAIGTPAYMSPEQAAGRLDQLGPASDVYSLGATLYHLLTGRPPFPEHDLAEVLFQVQLGRFPPPRQVERSVTPALEAICLKAMALAPEDRYRTARDLADDVERWLADEPVRAYAEPLALRLARWRRRHPRVVGGAAALLLTTVAALGLGYLLLSQEQGRTRQAQLDRARAQVDALLEANPRAVPTILEGLEPFRAQVLPRLREVRGRPDPREPQTSAARQRREHARTRASLALLAGDPGQVSYLRERLLAEGLEPEEMLLVRDQLAGHGHALAPGLWEEVGRPGATPQRRFRALVALARFDPKSPRWAAAAERVVEPLLRADPLHVGVWSAALRPVRAALLGPLGKVYRDRQRLAARRTAASLLSDYAADRPALLADLIADAGERQFAMLLPRLRAHGETAVALLHKELARPLAPSWPDTPLEASGPAPSPAVVREIEKAEGLVAERFALVQTLPLERAGPVVKALGRSGYRPLRFRPVTVKGRGLVAIVWARDGRDWRLALGLPAEKLRARDAEERRQGYRPVDVAGYLLLGAGERYAALWTSVAGEEARLSVGVHEERYPGDWEPLKKAGFTLRGSQVFRGRDGRRRFSSVWGKTAGNPESQESLDADEQEYEARASLDQVCLDVCLYPAAGPGSARAAAGVLAQAERDLSARPNDLKALYRRALACYQLGRYPQALADLNVVIAKVPSPRFSAGHLYRALVHAALSKVPQARADLAEFLRRSQEPREKVCIAALVAAHLGEDAEGLQHLEAALARQPEDAVLLYAAACVYSLASAAVARRNTAEAGAVVGLAAPGAPAWPVAILLGQVRERAGRPRRYRDRAVALLRQAVAAGYSDRKRLRTNPDLEPVRAHPGFAALLRQLRLDRQYSVVWHDSATHESAGAHGLDPAAHLARCRRLAAAGYRPAALAVAETTVGQPLVTASAWHRPVVGEAERVALARRQANAAVALLHLGRPERVWPLLRHSPYPDLRTYLIHRLGPLGVEARLLVERLEVEEVSARRALILALGEYTGEQLPAPLRRRLLPRLLRWYRSDPDPGIHGAIDWLLRHSREGPEPRKLDWGQAGALGRIDQELARQARAARVAAVAGVLGLLVRPACPAGLVVGSVSLPATPESVGGPRWYVNGQGQTLTLLPGPVEFLMGSPGSEQDRHRDESLHLRRIERRFAIATKPVTATQFQEFLQAHPEVRHSYVGKYRPVPDGPIISVTWYQAAAYCRWLSEKEGVPQEQMCYPSVREIVRCQDGRRPLKLPPDYLSRTGYRLPTEAEWEYACRSGARTSRSYGAAVELLPRHGWYGHNAQDRTWPVGQKKPNDLGLFDMPGNVLTWCQESSWPYPPGRPGRPALDREDNRDVTEALSRVLRGATPAQSPAFVRAASRIHDSPLLRHNAVGLRVARTAP